MPDPTEDERIAALLAEKEQAFASQLLAITTAMSPMREWLAGQRQYFLGEGYTQDEARAMAAASYVFMFGTRISPDLEPDEEPEE